MTTLLPGKIIGNERFEVVKLLDPGDFVHTYLVKDLQAGGTLCVLKYFTHINKDSTALNKANKLFEREAGIFRDITNIFPSRYIARFIHYFSENFHFYLVEEYIEGRTLREELDEKRRLSEKEVVEWLKNVLSALRFLHNLHKKIIHRDIKPENLMRRNQDNSLVLIDLGDAKFQQELIRLDAPGMILYTPGYAPPEQLQGKIACQNWDLYALGITMIEALTGRDAERIKKTNGKVLWPSQLQINQELVKILEKMVDNDHSKRYQSAEDVLPDIKQMEELKIKPSISTSPQPAQHQSAEDVLPDIKQMEELKIKPSISTSPQPVQHQLAEDVLPDIKQMEELKIKPSISSSPQPVRLLLSLLTIMSIATILFGVAFAVAKVLTEDCDRGVIGICKD